MASVVVCNGPSCRLHAQDVDRLRARAERVWTTDCLGPCDHASVVVVRTGAGRRWFGGVEPAALDAIASWLDTASPPGPMPMGLAAHWFEPDTTAAVGRRVERAPARLVAVVHELLESGSCGWTFGVLGAAAELPARFGAVVTRRGTTLEATGATAGLRLQVGADVAAFAFDAPTTGDVVALVLAVPRARLGRLPDRLMELGPDRDALDAADRDAALFDVGLGVPTASFGVRTADPRVQELLRHRVGAPWRELLAEVGADLVAAAPHRVVRTPVGRAEVRTPIPEPGGTSPSGPHTHLLPGELELGRELPAFMALPSGWATAAIAHPPAGWRLPPV